MVRVKDVKQPRGLCRAKNGRGKCEINLK